MSVELYDQEFDYAMSTVRSILRSIGAWPLPASSSITTKIAYRIKRVLTYFLFLFTIIPTLLYAALKTQSNRTRVKLFGPVFNSTMQLVKYSMVLYHAENIRRSIDLINRDWLNSNEQDRQILRSKAQIGRKLVWTSIVFMYGSGLCYRTIVPILRGKIVTAQNITIRPLACPGYFILFNEQATPFYEIVFMLQFFSGLASYAVMTGGCGISAFLVLHVCSQLRMLINKMMELGEGKSFDDDYVQQKLVSIIEHQTKTKRYLKDTQAIIEYISFCEVLSGTILTCLAGYYMIMEWESSNTVATLTYTVFLVCFIFCTFIFCYIGQLLDNESSNVGLKSTTINWYRLPERKARNLVLIIAMSHKPMKLVAGKIFDMSFATFTDIVKVSMGYLNILRKAEL